MFCFVITMEILNSSIVYKFELHMNWQETTDNMKLYIIICFLAFSEKLAICYSSTAGNTFSYVQSGNTTSNSCILEEFPINNQKVSALLQCGMPCTALSQCVGFDIIESISKMCRLLRGFAALIPSHTTSEAVRYEKVHVLKFTFVFII